MFVCSFAVLVPIELHELLVLVSNPNPFVIPVKLRQVDAILKRKASGLWMKFEKYGHSDIINYSIMSF
jgi:hypothetical protein